MINLEQLANGSADLVRPYTLTATFTGVLTGSLLVMIVSMNTFDGDDSHIISLVDDVNGAWTQIDVLDVGLTGEFVGEASFWYLANAASGDTNVTATFNDSGIGVGPGTGDDTYVQM